MSIVDEEELKRMNNSFAEYGIGGYNFSGDYAWTDFIPQLQWPRAGKVYEEMSKNDPTIGAVLFMAKQLVRRSQWSVETKGTSPRDVEAKKFLESCMGDMEQSWNEFVAEVLTMMPYGWAFHEVVYKIRGGRSKDPRLNSKNRDGKIGWRKIASRSQRTCDGWVIDQDNGDIKAMKQQAAPDYGTRLIPITKAIHFKTENDYGSPYGRSLLRNTYRPWFFKKRIEEIEGIGIERDLAGLPVLVPPDGVNIWDSDDPDMIKLKNASENLVKSIRRDQTEGVVHPFGWELKLLSTGSKRQFDSNIILNRYDQRIAITMLADIVMLGADKVGSFALADVKKSLLSAALETLLDSIADAINRQEVPRIMELNGFDDLEEYPYVKPDDVETPDPTVIASMIGAMSGAGMDVKDPELEAFIRKIASMPCIKEDIMAKKQKAYKEYIDNPPVAPVAATTDPAKVEDDVSGGDKNGEIVTNSEE